MAKKKKKLTRKQRIQQQRATIEQQRSVKPGRKIAKVRPAAPQRKLVDDMLPLFPLAADGAPTIADAEELMMNVLSSEDLADEPEFEDFFIDPKLCLDTYIEIAEERNLTPDILDALPDDEREATHAELMEATAKQLLTPELRQDILNRLNDLRLRLKQTGDDPYRIARVAAVQSFLGSKESPHFWPLMGLSQALVVRSLDVGFALMAATSESLGGDSEQEGESVLDMAERLSQTGLGQKIEGMINKIPGLGKMLKKQVDQAWDEGTDEIISGRLNLSIYTEAEIEAGGAIFKEVFAEHETEEPPDARKASSKNKEYVERLFTRWDEYVTGLFTPERLDQLRAHLRDVERDPSYRDWLAFIVLLRQSFEAEDAAEYEKPFLMKALFGEITALGLAEETEVEAAERAS